MSEKDPWELGGEDGELPEIPVVEMEITDVLDLHTFPPREIKHLVRDYLDLAVEKGFPQVRIIHGKGVGVQRRTVRSILERDERVVAYGDPPGESGGWGATWARLDTGEDSPGEASTGEDSPSTGGDES